ncbi:MAG: hypothetical protein K0S98_2376, partial [Propionibacteriaceae bacterium]|nr:hypothetical protein [Propionibacteriaceae bacterium]
NPKLKDPRQPPAHPRTSLEWATDTALADAEFALTTLTRGGLRWACLYSAARSLESHGAAPR